eukprot:4408075-Amphidinium_carterae.1
MVPEAEAWEAVMTVHLGRQPTSARLRLNPKKRRTRGVRPCMATAGLTSWLAKLQAPKGLNVMHKNWQPWSKLSEICGLRWSQELQIMMPYQG